MFARFSFFSKHLRRVAMLAANRRLYSTLPLTICVNRKTLDKINLTQRPIPLTLTPIINSSMNEQVRHMATFLDVKQDGKKFFIVRQGLTASLGYNVKDNIMTITHTKVPEELGGLGLGKLLAKAALDYAGRNELMLIIKCNFVTSYVEKYEPQYLQFILK